MGRRTVSEEKAAKRQQQATASRLEQQENGASDCIFASSSRFQYFLEFLGLAVLAIHYRCQVPGADASPVQCIPASIIRHTSFIFLHL